jgi:hypothetical protein
MSDMPTLLHHRGHPRIPSTEVQSNHTPQRTAANSVLHTFRPSKSDNVGRLCGVRAAPKCAVILIQLILNLLDEAFLVVSKVTAPLLHLAILNNPDLCAFGIVTKRVKERRVVGDDNNAATEGCDSFTEGIDGLHVEVVGGLVQEEDVGVGQSDCNEHDTGLLATGELEDGLHA